MIDAAAQRVKDKSDPAEMRGGAGQANGAG
jgi:hypothetical protein